MQTQPAAAAAKAVYDARGRTFRRFCRRNSAGDPRRHALGHAVRPKLPYTLLPGSMAYPRFRPGPCPDRQAENRGLGRGAPGQSHIRCPGRCCGGRAAAPPAGRALAPQAPKGSAPSLEENAAPIPHIKKILRRALCLGKDLFCLLRLFFSPLFAGQFSPLPLRPC